MSSIYRLYNTVQDIKMPAFVGGQLQATAPQFSVILCVCLTLNRPCQTESVGRCSLSWDLQEMRCLNVKNMKPQFFLSWFSEMIIIRWLLWARVCTVQYARWLCEVVKLWPLVWWKGSCSFERVKQRWRRPRLFDHSVTLSSVAH